MESNFYTQQRDKVLEKKKKANNMPKLKSSNEVYKRKPEWLKGSIALW